MADPKMEVKRYDVTACSHPDSDSGLRFTPRDDGEFVYYSAHAAAIAAKDEEIAKLEARLAEARSILDVRITEAQIGFETAQSDDQRLYWQGAFNQLTSARKSLDVSHD